MCDQLCYRFFNIRYGDFNNAITLLLPYLSNFAGCFKKKLILVTQELSQAWIAYVKEKTLRLSFANKNLCAVSSKLTKTRNLSE